MILYHGGNVAVFEPKLMPVKRLLDFGIGFYMTSDFEQANKWAQSRARIRKEGRAVVSVFDFDEGNSSGLNIVRFKEPDQEWLRYVVANRTSMQNVKDYDIVIGPVANDQTVRTISDYINGYLTEDMALQLLLPQKLKDQFAFKTETALQSLHFKETVQ